jgi:hypothetical protein
MIREFTVDQQSQFLRNESFRIYLKFIKLISFFQAGIFNQLFGSYEGPPYEVVRTFEDGVSNKKYIFE